MGNSTREWLGCRPIAGGGGPLPSQGKHLGCENSLDSGHNNQNRRLAFRLAIAIGVAFLDLNSGVGVSAAQTSCAEASGQSRKAIRKVKESVVLIKLTTIEGRSADGAGFVWDRSGHIITNHHVIASGNDPTIVTASGRRRPAIVVADFPNLDIAIVSIRGKLPQPVQRLQADKLYLGQKILTIGNPLGQGMKVSRGSITSLSEDIIIPPGISLPQMLRTDIPFLPGNSGGPVFDCQGRVIAIAAATMPQPDGSHVAGYAIPAAQVAKAVAQTPQRQQRAGLGVMLRQENEGRLVVAGILPETPAVTAGIRIDDVIVRANGQPTKRISQLEQHIRRTGVGKAMTISVERRGHIINLRVSVKMVEFWVPPAAERHR